MRPNAFRANTLHGKARGKKGETSVVARHGQRQPIGAASAVHTKRTFRYSTYQGCLNGQLFVLLLKQAMRHRTKPAHLALDGLPVRKTKSVKEYVGSTEGRLALHFLHGYAPELKADELLWSHVKRTRFPEWRRAKEGSERIEAQPAVIKNVPASVRAFFAARSVANITD